MTSTPRTGLTILSVLLALCGSSALGQGVDPAPLIYPDPHFGVGSAPQSVDTGDFNGDGIDDLVVPNWDSRNLSVLLGLGNGQFREQPRIPLGTRPNSAVVADFDLDGHDDVAVVLREVEEVAILLGLGDATFLPPATIPVGRVPLQVVTADFNGDQIPDLAVVNALSWTISILQGDGDGTFTARPAVFVQGEPRSLVVAPLNNDNTPDLVIVHGSFSGLSLRAGIGDGTFSLLPGVGVGDVPTGAGVGDFNQDGKSDLVVGRANATDVLVIQGLGNGQFGSRRTVAAAEWALGFVATDLDMDGRQDILFADQDLNEVSVLIGRGSLRFQPQRRLAVGDSPNFVRTGDFDQNGEIDFVVSNARSKDVSVHLGLGDGEFPDRSFSPLPSEPVAIATGKINGDDVDDVLTVSEQSDDLSIQMALGDGTLAPPVAMAVGENPVALAIADFDDDGNNDVIVANRSSNDVSVLMGSGGGNFDPESRIPVPGVPTSVAVGDFNNDSWPDVAVTLSSYGTLPILLGNGDGSFTTVLSPLLLSSVQQAVVLDADRDGIEDLVLAKVSRNGLFIVFGLGDGMFSPFTTIEFFSSRSRPASMRTGDLNSDGIADLAVAVGGFAGVIKVVLGVGDGTFLPSYDVGIGSSAGWLVIDDLDADGTDDIAATVTFLDSVSVLMGQGDRSFSDYTRYRAPGLPRAVDTSDLNQDGLPDLVVMDRDQDGIWILPQSQIILNSPPVADAGGNQNLECTSPDGASTILDGSGSSDPDSTEQMDDIISYDWFLDFGLPTELHLGTGPIIEVVLPLGVHDVTLLVIDSGGESDTDTAVISIADTTPPEISIQMSPSLLWPPNHRMIDVHASVMTSDLCSTPAVILESISSNEPDNATGGGDGNTDDDIQGADVGTPDFELLLRAERAGAGSGRIYTAVYRATDPSGNESSAGGHVTVPHSVGGMTEPLLITLAQNGSGTIVQWNEIPGAVHYSTVSGHISNIREKLNRYDLGSLTCIASGASVIDTTGFEHAVNPEPGEAFFYLTQYFDGVSSGYGTESAAKEVVSTGTERLPVEPPPPKCATPPEQPGASRSGRAALAPV